MAGTRSTDVGATARGANILPGATPTHRRRPRHGLRLEVVVVPVSDIDRSKRFYEDQVGFHVDVDHAPSAEFRVVQMTPPGSGCSVTIGTGLAEMAPGSLKGLQLCVADIEAAHAQLSGRGVPVAAIQRAVRHQSSLFPEARCVHDVRQFSS